MGRELVLWGLDVVPPLHCLQVPQIRSVARGALRGLTLLEEAGIVHNAPWLPECFVTAFAFIGCLRR